MRQKCVIFGAGVWGDFAYQKLRNLFDVAVYSDNNPQLWGGVKQGLKIIPPDELPELVKSTGAVIFIANERHYNDIARQLDGLSLKYYHYNAGLTYTREDETWYPADICPLPSYRKPGPEKFSVLFVQDKPCTRTNKIARALKDRGVLTYCAYSRAPSDEGARSFSQEFPIWSYAQLLDFVNRSEFDIVHCSNEPDIFVNVLCQSNKKVIHDCHDAMTIAKRVISPAEEVLEYLANTCADGVMYTTEEMRRILARKYHTPEELTLVVGNYPPDFFESAERLPKRSERDGAIHCVYEGTIVDSIAAKERPYRFYEPLFLRLAEKGVHIHIYSSVFQEYLKRLDKENPNIHYEGNYSGEDLISRMTQYDLGLLPVTEAGATLENGASHNKIYEYLSAGLPIATNISSYVSFLAGNGYGSMADFASDDIVSQMQKLRALTIPQDFCSAHGLTMDANADRILAFYQKILAMNV